MVATRDLDVLYNNPLADGSRGAYSNKAVHDDSISRSRRKVI
jgi:hypothetical protein